jgi:hypothetical protein
MTIPASTTMAMPTIPINALFGDEMEPNLSADYEQFILAADVIFGVDLMSQREFLVFGRTALRGILRSGQLKGLKVVRVALDRDTEELVKLIALIRELRGSDDYRLGEA